MNYIEEMKLQIEKQLKDVKKYSPLYQCGCQLAEIAGTSEGLAQLVLEDFANKRDVKGCEEEIKKFAKAHGGGCSTDKAAEIICQYFGLPQPPAHPDPLDVDAESAAAPTATSAPKPKVLTLADLL